MVEGFEAALEEIKLRGITADSREKFSAALVDIDKGIEAMREVFPEDSIAVLSAVMAADRIRRILAVDAERASL